MKIYLDTSVISAYFDSRNPERQVLTQDFFDQISDYDPYISELIRISQLSDKYMEAGAITRNYPEDAYHNVGYAHNPVN